MSTYAQQDYLSHKINDANEYNVVYGLISLEGKERNIKKANLTRMKILKCLFKKRKMKPEGIISTTNKVRCANFWIDNDVNKIMKMFEQGTVLLKYGICSK